MRYRPFNRSGLSTSAITVAIPAGSLRETDAFRLICTALEHGINSFDIADGDEAAAAALRQAIASVGRGVLVLTLRLERVDADEELTPTVRTALHTSGAGFFDVLMLDEACALTPRTCEQIEALKAARLVRMAGMAGDREGAEAALAAPEIDVLSTTYNLRSGWPERNRLKAASTRGMTLVGRNFSVDPARAVKLESPKGLGRLFRKPPPAQVQHAYDFMKETRGWTPHQISLAYALTEPSLATVQVETASPALVEELAGTVERQLPAGVTAQIELARVAILAEANAA
ncbi:MAG: aldo/keto reductase [Caulobacteraceae bacterium]